jgi:hypothetical protein
VIPYTLTRVTEMMKKTRDIEFCKRPDKMVV